MAEPTHKRSGRTTTLEVEITAIRRLLKRLADEPAPRPGWFARVWSVGFKTALYALFCLLIIAMFWQIVASISRQQIVLSIVQVPANMAQAGITREVVARKIADEINKIGQSARWSPEKLPRPIATEARQTVSLKEIQVPLAGFSVETVVQIIRDPYRKLLKLEDIEISGDLHELPEGTDLRAAGLECSGLGNEKRLLLTLRLSGRPHAFCGPATKMQGLFRAAAIRSVESLDPYVLAAYYYWQENDRELTEKAIEIALRDPKRQYHVRAYRLRGDMAFDHRQFARALQHYEQAGAEDESGGAEHPELYLAWASALYELGRPDKEPDAKKSQALLEKADQKAGVAIKHAPKFAAAHHMQAKILRQLKKCDEAVKRIDRIIQWQRDGEIDSNPGSRAGTLNQRGRALVCLGNFSEAVKSFEAAIRLKPNEADHFAGLGDAYWDMLSKAQLGANAAEIEKKAFEAYCRAYRLDDRSEDAGRGFGRLKVGDYDARCPR